MGRRRHDFVNERIRVKTLGVFVFFASVATLLFLDSNATGPNSVRATAGAASATEHTAHIRGVVQQVHVRPGDDVGPGTPLVTLSSRRVEREILRLDTEITRLEKEALMAHARLMVIRNDLFARAHLELKQTEIQRLRDRRDALIPDRNTLTLRARQFGRIAHVAPLGTAVDVGTPLVTFYPHRARGFMVNVPAYIGSALLASIGSKSED